MSEPFDDIALTAAINLLRDSIESGKMPSGSPLPPDAADLHAQAAGHLEAQREQLRSAPHSAVPSVDPAGEGRAVNLSCLLTDGEAWNLAQFLKRVGFSDFRTNAQDDDEAYAMRDAADRVRVALAEVGYAPR